MELFESTTFASLVTNLLRQYHIPGLSVAVVHNDKIASTSYGMANYEDSIPCTGDTLFDIASSSKSLTAASVALLVDDKKHPKVQYDALMSDLLPDNFLMAEETYTNGVTVEDILSHRTGMASHDSAYMGPKATHPDNARSITRNLRNLQVAAPLRSRYLYCNQMFTVATHLVEETSKQSFADFLEERIFAPLNMTSTTLQPTSAHSKGWGDRLAKGYIWKNNMRRGFDPQDCPEGQGAGSVISSANDFIKWVKALLYHEGPINDRVYQGLTKMRSIVNPNARRLKANTTPAIYTAGMEMYFYRGNMVVGHDGNIPGFSSRFLFMPDSKFGVVVLGNSAEARRAVTVIMRVLMDEVLGVPVEDRLPQKNNKREENQLKKDLAIHSKVQHQHQRECQLKNQQPGQAKEQSSKDSYVESKAAPQGPASRNGRTKEKAKEENNKGTRKPEWQKKQEEKPKNCEQPPSPQEISLGAYVGRYWNAGYRAMEVQIKDGQLFIDATDRSMGFTMTFKHVKDQTKYIAYLKDDIELTVDPVDAEFVFEDRKVVKMGLDLEPTIKEMIWFRRGDN